MQIILLKYTVYIIFTQYRVFKLKTARLDEMGKVLKINKIKHMWFLSSSEIVKKYENNLLEKCNITIFQCLLQSYQHPFQTYTDYPF